MRFRRQPALHPDAENNPQDQRHSSYQPAQDALYYAKAVDWEMNQVEVKTGISIQWNLG